MYHCEGKKMNIQTLTIVASLLLASCTVTAKQTGEKDWAVSIKPDGTGVNIQPTQPQATTSPTATASPIFSPSPIPNPSFSPSALTVATPAPSFTQKNSVIKPSPIATQPIIQPCSKFTYQYPTISLTLSNGIVRKKIAIPSCKIQSFSIKGISGAELIIDGGGAGVAIIKGNNLLAQSSQATKGIASLNHMSKGQYKVEIVSRQDKFFIISFKTKNG
jgi:hypothetical protein